MHNKKVNYREMLKAADDNFCAAEIIWDASEKLHNQYSLLLALSGEIYLKYILSIKCGRNGIGKHDLLYLYEMLSKDIQDEIKCILIDQPKKFKCLIEGYGKYPLSHYLEALEENKCLFIDSRYYYEDYQKQFYKFFDGIYEIIKAFKTYAHSCENDELEN